MNMVAPFAVAEARCEAVNCGLTVVWPAGSSDRGDKSDG